MERPGGRLTSQQIKDIIKSGRDNGAKSVTIHKSGVTVTYFDPVPVVPIIPTGGSAYDVGDMVYKQGAEISKQLDELRQDELMEQIKLLDPERYEQLMADGVIEDVHDE